MRKLNLEITKCVLCGDNIPLDTFPHYCPGCVLHLVQYGCFPVVQQNTIEED